MISFYINAFRVGHIEGGGESGQAWRRFLDVRNRMKRALSNHLSLSWDGRDELRWQFTGFDGRGILTVRFTIRSGIIRVIGAGYWRKQRKIYETKKKSS